MHFVFKIRSMVHRRYTIMLIERIDWNAARLQCMAKKKIEVEAEPLAISASLGDSRSRLHRVCIKTAERSFALPCSGSCMARCRICFLCFATRIYPCYGGHIMSSTDVSRSYVRTKVVFSAAIWPPRQATHTTHHTTIEGATQRCQQKRKAKNVFRCYTNACYSCMLCTGLSFVFNQII